MTGFTLQPWLIYALLAAACAAAVPLLAKVGMEGIDSTLATAVRAVVMVVFLFAVCTAEKVWHELPTIRGRALLMITLSGIAGAASWLFGFKALQVGGRVTQVAPIDKLSVPLAALLAFILLHERPTRLNWLGIGLIVAGAYLTAVKADVGMPKWLK